MKKKVIERIVRGSGAPNTQDIWLNDNLEMKVYENEQWKTIAGGSGSDGGSGSGPGYLPPMVVEGIALDRRVDYDGQFLFIPKSDEASFQEAINQLDAGGLLYLKTNVGVSSVYSSAAKEAKYAITGYNADMIWSTAVTYKQGRSYAIVWDKQEGPEIVIEVDYDNADYTQSIDNGGSLSFWFINYDGNITRNDEILLSINNFSLNIVELMPSEEIPEEYLMFGGYANNSEYSLGANLMDVPTAAAFFENQGFSLNIPEDCNYVVAVAVSETVSPYS